jgi:hypothetical protein
MPSNSTGKWVERAATTGGGRTYRGQMPVNWYASLVVIIVVGLALIGFSRYQRTHQTTSSSGPPTTSQVWYAALGIDVCGTLEANLPASTNTKKTGLTANGDGVLTIAPKNSSESGANATLGKFVSGYKGLQLTASTLQYPGKAVYTNGEVCPKGTPDAGKPGVVIVDYWSSFGAKGKGTQPSGDPQDLLFTNGQLITMAFVPATSSVPKPSGTVVASLITSLESSSTTTTTSPSAAASTTTTAPGATTTTTPAATTTTAPSATTTTTAPSATTTTGASK